MWKNTNDIWSAELVRERLAADGGRSSPWRGLRWPYPVPLCWGYAPNVPSTNAQTMALRSENSSTLHLRVNSSFNKSTWQGQDAFQSASSPTTLADCRTMLARHAPTWYAMMAVFRTPLFRPARWNLRAHFYVTSSENWRLSKAQNTDPSPMEHSESIRKHLLLRL